MEEKKSPTTNKCLAYQEKRQCTPKLKQLKLFDDVYGRLRKHKPNLVCFANQNRRGGSSNNWKLVTTRCDDHFIMYIITESLCCTTETDKVLYVNYSSIKKKRQTLFWEIFPRQKKRTL